MTENRFDSSIFSDFHVVSFECLKHILVNTPVGLQLGNFYCFWSAFNLIKYIRTGFGRQPEKVLEKCSKRQDAVKNKHEVLTLKDDAVKDMMSLNTGVVQYRFICSKTYRR